MLLTPRHMPAETLVGHLTFALKYEGLDLAVLATLFRHVGSEPIEQLVSETPTGRYSRRVWFLYEWLLDEQLSLSDASSGPYVDVVDEDLQYGRDGRSSSRHRVNDNLPGSRAFCPLVFRTDALEAHRARDLASEARQVIDRIPPDVLRRAAAFLLLKDSRSSYAIEGERPPRDREQRWARAIGQAGQHELSRAEFERLQQLVIGDARFVRLGLRQDGGFVGQHDRESRTPIPDHISARPEDLESLIQGLVDFEHKVVPEIDPVMAAAMLAFGFVYIHPFEDGNGRIHRYLIHHVLSRRGFQPPGLVFPVSSVILDRIDEYRDVLGSYSERLLPCIDWDATEDGNVAVQNETALFYRYFDATPHAEFLVCCVEQTIEDDLPAEADFLRKFDAFKESVGRIVDMPDSTIDLLFRFLEQNSGT
ncbi:MAG: Fic family protein, partial [Myxococcota bacterium]